MRSLILVFIGVFNMMHSSFSQDVTDKYLEFVYGGKSDKLKGNNTNIIVGEVKVSPRRPLIIRTPDKTKKWNVYTFNQIFDNGIHKAFVSGIEDPYKPKLIIINKDSVEIDELQLLGDSSVLNAWTGRQILEEVVIKNKADITHSVWTISSNDSKSIVSKTAVLVRRFKISNLGKIEIVLN